MKKIFSLVLVAMFASTIFINIPVSAYEVLGDNLVINGDMSSTTSWINYGTPKTKEIVNGEMHVTTRVGVRSGIQQTKIPVEAGQKYRLSLYARVPSGWTKVILGNNKSNWDFDPTYTNSLLQAPIYGNGAIYTRDFTAPVSRDFRLVFITNKEFYVDNIQIQKVTEIADPILPVDTTDPSLSAFRSDGDYDGNEDHTQPTRPDPLGFSGACQTSPDIWESADFIYAIDQINDVIGKLNQYENANLDPANFRSMYKTLCLDNDMDGDQVYRQGPYYDPADAGNGCLYNDKDDTIANREQNNCTDSLFVKIPWEGTPGWTDNTPQDPPVNPPTDPNPPIDPNLPIDPNPPQQPPTFNPTPHNSDETYLNEQNVDFTLFPTLKFEDYTGKTYYVSTTGVDTNSGETLNAPLKTIQTALTKAVDGDKILIREGIYTENYTGRTSELLDINHSIYFGAYNGESVTIQPGTGGDNRKAIGFSATGKENTTIDGIKLVNFTRVGIGLYFLDFKNIVIKNVDITMPNEGLWSDATGIAMYGDMDKATVLTSIKGLLIENVKVTNANMGISCGDDSCENVKLSNVVINNHYSPGDSSSDCFAMENGTNVALINLEATNCGADGIDIKGDKVFILKAFVHNVSRNGIKLWQGGDIINSIVNDTGADLSIYFGDGGKARLINSVVANNSKDGRAYVLASSYHDSVIAMKIQIINSIVYQNSSNSGAMLLMPNTNGTTRILDVQNSIFYREGGQIEYDDIETNTTMNDPSKHNLINVNPQFVNPGKINGDFKLEPNSPALNAGINTEYNFDFLNVLRQIDAFDVGAYEM